MVAQGMRSEEAVGRKERTRFRSGEVGALDAVLTPAWCERPR